MEQHEQRTTATNDELEAFACHSSLVTCHCFLHLRSTFRTELRRAFRLMTGRGASQLRRLRRRAAFGPELRFADIRAAVRTDRPSRCGIRVPLLLCGGLS